MLQTIIVDKYFPVHYNNGRWNYIIILRIVMDLNRNSVCSCKVQYCVCHVQYVQLFHLKYLIHMHFHFRVHLYIECYIMGLCFFYHHHHQHHPFHTLSLAIIANIECIYTIIMVSVRIYIALHSQNSERNEKKKYISNLCLFYYIIVHRTYLRMRVCVFVFALCIFVHVSII